MKKNLSIIFFMTAIAISVIGCKDKAKQADTTEAEEVKTEVKVDSEKYIADVSASTIEWKGFKPTGSHNGTISLDTGVLKIADGNITGGTFLINMGSLKDAEGSAKLEGHLKSPDFFDVEKHPSAAFEITGIEQVEGKTMLSGNLTLKAIKNNVTFPVNITNENNVITLSSEAFTIDRTKWKIEYKSKSIFSDLAEKFINDDIELKVMIKANKS